MENKKHIEVVEFNPNDGFLHFGYERYLNICKFMGWIGSANKESAKEVKKFKVTVEYWEN